MKPSLFPLLFTLFMGHLLSAQSAAPVTAAASSDPEVRKTTDALDLKYSFNADQAKQM